MKASNSPGSKGKIKINLELWLLGKGNTALSETNCSENPDRTAVVIEGFFVPKVETCDYCFLVTNLQNVVDQLKRQTNYKKLGVGSFYS